MKSTNTVSQIMTGTGLVASIRARNRVNEMDVTIPFVDGLGRYKGLGGLYLFWCPSVAEQTL